MDVDEDDDNDLPGDVPPAISTAVVSEHSSCDESSLLESHQRGRRRKVRNAAEMTLDIPPSITEAACNSSEDEQSVGSVMTEGSTGTGGKLLYNDRLDDEDEAYVYKHMRSGLEEEVFLEKHKQEKNQAEARASSSIMKDESDMETASVSTNPQLEKALMLKPRTSDAVLSCPRCFNIVCMDCQQHESYANQFRAMFVMNIGVDWGKRMYFDEASGRLRPSPKADSEQGDRSAPQMEFGGQGEREGGGPIQVPHDNVKEANSDEVNGREQYYSVHCGYCQHDLAALDMKDEIYHFYGCIPSS